MSTDADIESIDVVLEEDKIDLEKVSDIKKLGTIAQSNTNQFRKIQRKLLDYREDPTKQHLIEPLEQAMAKRQNRSMKLIKKRRDLQTIADQEKKHIIEEALRPTSGYLNTERQRVISHLTDMLARIVENKEKYKEYKAEQIHTPEQRKLEARLKQWELTITMMIQTFDKVLPLPTDLD